MDAKVDGRASVDLGLLLGGPEEGVAADGDEGCGDHQHHAEVEGRRARRVLARAARRRRSHPVNCIIATIMLLLLFVWPAAALVPRIERAFRGEVADKKQRGQLDDWQPRADKR